MNVLVFMIASGNCPMVMMVVVITMAVVVVAICVQNMKIKQSETTRRHSQ